MHEKFMDVALAQANIAFDKGNLPIGACIVLNDEVIATGYNEVDSAKNDSLHAEMAAIQKVPQLLFENKYKATLYTTLEPCAMCIGAIVNAGIREIVYAVKDEYVGAIQTLKQQKFYHRKLEHVKEGVCSAQAQALLNLYVSKFQVRDHLKK